MGMGDVLMRMVEGKLEKWASCLKWALRMTVDGGFYTKSS
jgi:hypothetical protein